MAKALYAPHRLNVLPQRTKDTKTVEVPLVVKHKCDLGCGLILWEAAKARNDTIPGWAVSEPNKMQGLLTMVSGLGLQGGIKVQRGIAKALKKTRTSDVLFDFLQEQAMEWQGEAKQGKAQVAEGRAVYLAAGIAAGGQQQGAPATALVAGSGPQLNVGKRDCDKWVYTGNCAGCTRQHDPAKAGRKDFMPVCYGWTAANQECSFRKVLEATPRAQDRERDGGCADCPLCTVCPPCPSPCS